MRFKGAVIKDFKRFTHLTIQGVPETARLIMLAGPNGSGKSSFFDALNSWHKLFARGGQWNDDYHLKVYSRNTSQWNQDHLAVTCHQPLPGDDQEKKKAHLYSICISKRPRVSNRTTEESSKPS